MQSSHYFPRALPNALQDLATLALDLRWSWNHGADDLWCAVDPDLWTATQNPWLILETVSDQRLAELARDKTFLEALRQQITDREQHFQTETWFSSAYGNTFDGQIAYFSMEFGLSESLPIYSGGLGVLAGDFMKTASDLDVPLVGIGLLYQQGYFRQAINAAGEQLESYPFNDPTMLPVVPLRDDQGEWVRISIELPGRLLRLRTWHARAGRRALLLLDSNDLLNDPGDRGITSELYGGGAEMRLQQEMVLGIGGWRLLERLGMECPVCHLNEGHAAFAILERARFWMQRNKQPFSVALRATRAGNLFTTHTPIAAGFDRFDPALFGMYFEAYAEQLGIGIDELVALGRCHADDATEPFNMAYLAVRGAGGVNAVSQLHGEVSRSIFQPLFPRWSLQEIPVGHISNGVHVPSWDSEMADALWTEACGKSRWRGTLESVEAGLRQVSDERLWGLRSNSRQRLIDFLQQRFLRQPCSDGASFGHAQRRIDVPDPDVLDPDVLTLGFARRFAEYKRTNLLLHDPQRLIRLLTDRDRPVQLVLAGKAHPRDAAGKQLLRAWQDFLRWPEVRGRVVFVEDYDLVVAGQLTQGVDVWINTPRRPWEASGTSGMKVLVNGGLNLSELDGWWAEAYTAEAGWALGDGREHADTVGWDSAEAEQLYRVLENDVVPCFYRRDELGIPRDWTRYMRESMAGLTTRYSSNRMLREYVETYYLPLADAYRKRSADIAVALQVWCQQLTQHWPRIHFGNVTSMPTEAGHQFEVQVYLDDLSADMVQVELYAEPAAGGDVFRQPLAERVKLAGTSNAYAYHGIVPGNRSATDYTARIVPVHASASVPLEANSILWYR